MADFETTTNPDDCRVWAWGIVDIDNTEEFIYGTDIESFFQFCAENSCVVYFHNLAFDGVFILDRIMKENFNYVKDRRKLKPGTFNSLIDSNGKFYTIVVKWGTGKITEFRDSLKKLPMSVKRIGEAYKTGMSKGSIDYEEDRPIGHELTEEEIDYLKTDVLIVAKALKTQFDEGMLKLTTGADSLYEYTNLMGKKQFKALFPLLNFTMDAEVRKAYRGGWTYVSPKYARRVTGGGMVFDVNSLYPYVMKTRLLPYGMPIFIEGPPQFSEEYPLAIFSVTFTATIKPNHHPCIQDKMSRFFLNVEYLNEITEPMTTVCTSVDWKLWNDQYDIEVISFNGLYMFHGTHGLFDEYINKWAKIKAESSGGLREIAKLHLNSLYGKFATNPDVTGKHPVLENDRIKFEMNEQEFRDPIYTPMGVFITAYARDVTIRAAQDNYDCFAYADTDSLHLITDTEPENLNIHPSELGAWKKELEFNSAFYARPKAYCEKVLHKSYNRKVKNYEYITHIAGLPVSIADKVTLSDFVNGRVFEGKLHPERVPGGVVLRPVAYTLKW